MDLHKKIYTTEVDGSPFTFEISDLAGQADGAVIARWGETEVLATACMGGESSLPYFPLTVDYEERFYAAGKILGSRFVRREGRPSDEATLSARLIDRTIRPLFDQRLRREIQVVITVLSYDREHDPDLPGLVAASLALGISRIPWGGPVGGARFMKEKEANANDTPPEADLPLAGNRMRTTRTQLEHLAFFAGTDSRVNMIELEGDEVSEGEAEKIFAVAEKQIRELVALQKKIIAEIGEKKIEIIFSETDSRLRGEVKKFLDGKLRVGMDKNEFSALESNLLDYLEKAGENPETLRVAKDIFEHQVDAYVHAIALKEEKRIDGRALDEIRPLHAETSFLKRPHGTGLFIRGNTQVLAVVTLAPPSGEQIVETMRTDKKERFILHYNFPSYSVGEAGRNRGPGRREIGHGMLALKALRPMLPAKDVFPYAIRIVAETLSSNGSSSMATTCGGCLAMLDAGVPLKKHVAGIAMGLMVGKNGEYKVLTDIQGPEDHYGDMDFKVAGTADGITAIQMDVKCDGVTKEMFLDTLAAARKARLQILEVMKKALPEARELSPRAPRIITIKIDPSRIGELIGPGGKVINGILDSVNNEATIDIDDDGTVYIGSEKAERADEVVNIIQNLFKEYSIGEIVEGPIVRILEFGAIVDLGGGKDGMIHVSELKEGFVKNVTDVVKLGDRVRAKVVKLDNGKIGLSLKGLNK